MKTWAIRIGVAAAALVLTFLAGRYTGRTKVTEEAQKTTVAVTASTTAEHKDVTSDEVVDRKTTIRKAPGRAAAPPPPSGICADCPAVDETVIEEQVRKKLLDRGMTATIASGSVVTEEHSSKVTEYARPSWSVALLAGWKPDAATLTPSVYQVQADRRIFGTVWVGAWVQGEDVPDRPEKRGGWKVTAAGALARAEF